MTRRPCGQKTSFDFGKNKRGEGTCEAVIEHELNITKYSLVSCSKHYFTKGLKFLHRIPDLPNLSETRLSSDSLQTSCSSRSSRASSCSPRLLPLCQSRFFGAGRAQSVPGGFPQQCSSWRTGGVLFMEDRSRRIIHGCPLSHRIHIHKELDGIINWMASQKRPLWRMDACKKSARVFILLSRSSG